MFRLLWLTAHHTQYGNEILTLKDNNLTEALTNVLQAVSYVIPPNIIPTLILGTDSR
jgi:hypothetical protein